MEGRERAIYALILLAGTKLTGIRRSSLPEIGGNRTNVKNFWSRSGR